MAFAPDGRLFICLQGGQVRVVKNGALLPTPFLSVNVNSSGERGLLGIAFDPNFASNQFVYVYYTTAASPIHNRVTPSNAQTLANLHGKILRINADGSIPTDNPFFNMASGKNRTIWAMGLRNPFTFASQAGHSEPRMFINDVGQNTYEEINDVCRRASPNSNADGESDAEWPAGDA